ncbi:short coiled-coil protein isoform 1-T2 [Vipera latastei]
MMNADMDAVETENQVELEEKTRLINQVLELQHTLEDLSARVDAVKEENLKLKSENQVLGQYIENLMSASSVFQTTDTKSKRNCQTICLTSSFPIPSSSMDMMQVQHFRFKRKHLDCIGTELIGD